MTETCHISNPAPAGNRGAPPLFRLLLAPMEGLADNVLRDILTRPGGYDGAVTEFVRVTDTLLPARTYLRISPELRAAGCTRAGTPVAVQLLGSDAAMLAANAARLARLSPPAIDLNFGCPAPLVNRHHGGAALLADPEGLYRIVHAVRRAVPAALPVTAKMRLGLHDTSLAIACAQALVAGGAAQLVVHGRTRDEGYRPPAHWDWIGKIRAALPAGVPVVANGEVWTLADWQRCRAESGCADVMLGRGAVADPLLARRIRAAAGQGAAPDVAPVVAPDVLADPADWQVLQPLIAEFWQLVQAKVQPRHAPGRLKQWLGLLARQYPQAAALMLRVRPLRQASEVSRLLQAEGLLPALAATEPREI